MSFTEEITEDRTESTPIGPQPAPSARIVEPVEDPISEDEAKELEKQAAGMRERAFSGAEYHTWRDRPLFPFSSGRESLWLELRTAVGAPRLSQALGGDQRAMLPDAARILFLCFFPHTAKESRKKVDDNFATLGYFRRVAGGDMFALQESVESWAEQYICGDEEIEAAIDLALLIFRESRINRAEVTPKTGGRAGSAANLGE